MYWRNALLFILAFSIFLSGCSNDALNRADQQVSVYDFKGALEALDQVGGN